MPELSDLYNPDGVNAILTTTDRYIVADPRDQAFQKVVDKEGHTKGYELWQKMEDGRLMKVEGFYKTFLASYVVEFDDSDLPEIE